MRALGGGCRIQSIVAGGITKKHACQGCGKLLPLVEVKKCKMQYCFRLVFWRLRFFKLHWRHLITDQGATITMGIIKTSMQSMPKTTITTMKRHLVSGRRTATSCPTM